MRRSGLEKMTSFSERLGYKQTIVVPITIREDAPRSLREAVILLAEKCEMRPSQIRSIICNVLLTRPDPDNWSEYPNISYEIYRLIEDCQWYRVYDIIEKIYEHLIENFLVEQAAIFREGINQFFMENGIGWQLENKQIIARGNELFQEMPKRAAYELELLNQNTAAVEIHEALNDISRRPADITGAIQHAMAALECTARKYSGSNETLGKILQNFKNELNIPSPLDKALEKLWGYASEKGRHLQEGRTPAFEEAELVVNVCAATVLFLNKK